MGEIVDDRLGRDERTDHDKGYLNRFMAEKTPVNPIREVLVGSHAQIAGDLLRLESNHTPACWSKLRADRDCIRPGLGIEVRDFSRPHKRDSN